MPVGVQCPISSSLGEFPSYWDWLLYGGRIATHSVDPSLTHFLGEFPGLGLVLVPDVVVPEADIGAHGAENSIQISALAGVEPRTLALDLPRTPPFSRLLRHAGGYVQQDNSNL